MNLQTSTSLNFNERRILFAHELDNGGHGQVVLKGAGTYVPSPDHLFYQIDFLQNTVVGDVVFRSTNSAGTTIYTLSADTFDGVTFPALYSWSAPVSSITITSGLAIAYQYKLFSIEDLYCK